MPQIRRSSRTLISKLEDGHAHLRDTGSEMQLPKLLFHQEARTLTRPSPSSLTGRSLILGLLWGVSLTVTPGAAQAAPSIDPALAAWAGLQGSVAINSDASALTRPPDRSTWLSTEGSEEWASVLLVGTVHRRDVERLGGVVETVTGSVLTAHLPRGAVGRLTELPGLIQAQVAQPLEPQTDVSIPEIGANIVWGGPPPNFPSSGVTGRNVVVGIVDSRSEERRVGKEG